MNVQRVQVRVLLSGGTTIFCKGRRMKILLWIIGIIFVVGLLTITGVFSLLF
ncbi:hypothetical protein [Pigmentiphaga litoralis]|uniref:hypothetical protein n=1 Tax=Pigmentiphaga litoralis TaxID=516702 RepID=UPI0016799542|nr:hypothetical protein [Pigmentiphaga litoralis]